MTVAGAAPVALIRTTLILAGLLVMLWPVVTGAQLAQPAASVTPAGPATPAATPVAAPTAAAAPATTPAVAPLLPSTPGLALPVSPSSAVPAAQIAVVPAQVAPAPALVAPAAGKAAPPAAKPAAPIALIRPFWHELTPAQHFALAPLANDWNQLDGFRKKKWLEIGNKFANMKPDEQLRLQERMREWAKLTPEQRRVARETFSRAKKLAPEQKSAQWEQYQQLPEEQKKQLAASASAKSAVAALPRAQSKAVILPPIKSTPKPVLEKSLTPAATTRSNIPQAPAPTAAPANPTINK